MKSRKNTALRCAAATVGSHEVQRPQIHASPLSAAVHRALRDMTRRQIAPLMALSLAGLATPALAQDAVVELSALDGSNGFVLNGVTARDYSGRSVSAAGDVNGDGVDDLLIGAHRADPNGSESGASYVVFGASGVGSSGTLELSALDGSSGFVLNGVTTGDNSGFSVSAAGDVNGDGVDDLLIGAFGADPNGIVSGTSYVMFGASGVGSSGTLALSALDGSNGFVLNGVTTGDGSGESVSAAGDVNGDGVDDLLIGASSADPNGIVSGASYVVFGASGVGSGGMLELSSLNGSSGFVLNGVTGGDLLGDSVSAAGDVNGDGIDDLLIGAYGADPNGRFSGASYVVFGASGVGSSGTLELSALDGSSGFVLNGVATYDESGTSVSAAGDINGDGVDDLLIGADDASPNGSYSGASYVVFGASGVGSSGTLELSDLDGGNGFVLNGVTTSDSSGRSVSAAGDVNGDGVDDLLIGADLADPNGSDSGASYVVFGASGVGSSGTLELSSLDGSNGFVLNGVTAGDNSGFSVSAAGDVNGDGVDDLLIGAHFAGPNGSTSGASYVVFGEPLPGSIKILKNVVGSDFTSLDFDFMLDGVTPFNLSENDPLGYEQTGLTAGMYSVVETVPSGWTLSLIDCGTGQNNVMITDGINIVLEAGEDVVCTFNNTPPAIGTGQIGDFVWQDNNGNGRQDAGEPGVEGVTVNLWSSCTTTAQLFDTTLSDGNGAYLFEDLPADDYQLEFIKPAGYTFSPNIAAGDYTKDSNPDEVTGLDACRPLAVDQQRPGLDAGLIPTGGPMDTLTVLRAIYYPKDNRIWIKADSDALVGSAIITATAITNGVETVLGEVGWKAGKSAYQQAFNNLTAIPDTIKLVSDQGGMVTATVEGGGGSSADTLTVVKAIYFSADDKLWIKADSDASPAGSATITAVMVINGVETVLGEVAWKPSKNAYQQVYKNLPMEPDSIILTSNLGGTVAGSVSGQ